MVTKLNEESKIPISYKMAAISHSRPVWLKTMKTEMTTLNNMEAWDVVELPPVIKICEKKFSSREKAQW